MLSLDEIQTAIAANFKRETVAVDSFGGEIELRELSVPAKAILFSRYADDDGRIEVDGDRRISFFVDLVALSVSKPLNMDTPKGRAAIQSMTIDELTTIANKCIELSDMGVTDEDEGKKKLEPAYHRFAMELCLELGYPHPDYLFQVLNARQFDDWQRYYNEHPFGETRADERQRMLVSALGILAGGESDGLWESFHFPYFKVPKSNKEALEALKRYNEQEAAKNDGH